MTDDNNPWASSPKPPPRVFKPNPNAGRPNSNGGGNNMPPPFEFIKKQFDQSGSIKPFVILGLVLVSIWLASGLYRVLPEENAVVLRFGQYMGTVTEPGLHYHLPSPIETIMKPNVTFERRLEIGYRGAPFQGSSKTDVPEESMMLTGDANIVDLDFVVQWKVAEAKSFLFNVRDPEATLKRVAESAMREVVGQNELQDIITDRREDIAARVKTIMQDILKSYQAGIMVTQVLIQDATVPPPVLDAFEDVIRANQQAETMRNQALRYRNEIVPGAQGEAIRLVKEAEAYKESIVADAKGDAQRFTDVYESYAKAKDVTRTRLYMDTWQTILQSSSPIIMDGSKSGAVPYMNLNELRSKAAAQGDVK
jgi:membrane protease subunit HflK